MMIFTAYRKNNSLVAVYYDPIDHNFSVVSDKGDDVKEAIPVKEYLEYVTALGGNGWNQLEFKAIAKLDFKQRK